MRIREYTSGDFDDLRRMHAAQGFGYPLPDLESPLFVSKLVLEVDAEDTCAETDGDAEKEAADARKEVEQARREAAAVRRESAEARTECARTEAASANSLRESGSSSCVSVARSRQSGRVAMAILQRLTAETYLLHDPAAGTPRLRWQRFLALHDAARRAAAAKGFDDVQAFLPPPVARAFGRRLSRLGWTRDPWSCFSLRV